MKKTLLTIAIIVSLVGAFYLGNMYVNTGQGVYALGSVIALILLVRAGGEHAKQ